VVVAEADCDATRTPIVFVHGTYGSGDNIANVALLLMSNGFCASRFFAIEYNSLGDQPATNGQLDAFIDKVRTDTGADKVVLMGHSQGTTHSRTYLADPQHAAKVSHYVHLAGGPLEVPTEPPTLCVASNADATATGLCPTMAAESLVFEDHDHFAVASSDETFVGIYKFLQGEDPTYTEIQCGSESITLEAVVESFADNAVPVGATVEIYEFAEEPRERAAPVETFTVGQDGAIGPWQAKRLQQYEFKAIDGQGQVIGRQYITSLKRDNRLIRFLVPSENVVVAPVTNNIVRGEGHSAVIARSYKGAFRSDLGDSLKVNDAEVLFEGIANSTSATVGLFMFDDNTNQASDGGSLPNYSALPFIRGTDVFMSASSPGFVKVDYNGSVMNVPNWPSGSEGPMIVIFP
jgi:pimeloyl-ACP methyl ester carboxylesterase